MGAIRAICTAASRCDPTPTKNHPKQTSEANINLLISAWAESLMRSDVIGGTNRGLLPHQQLLHSLALCLLMEDVFTYFRFRHSLPSAQSIPAPRIAVCCESACYGTCQSHELAACVSMDERMFRRLQARAKQGLQEKTAVADDEDKDQCAVRLRAKV
jgi:hypothetical protein